MIFQFKQIRKTYVMLLVITCHLAATADESCSAIIVREDRSIDLSIKRESLQHAEAWTIKGAFIVNKTVNKTFEAAKKIERLQQIIPFINIFRLSEDRKKLQCGIKLLPGLSFQQVFLIDMTEETKLINLQFTEGSFAGLIAQICFSAVNENQTAVTLTTTGSLPEAPVPFFITNTILESIGKSVIKRWRNQIESSD